MQTDQQALDTLIYWENKHKIDTEKNDLIIDKWIDQKIYSLEQKKNRKKMPLDKDYKNYTREQLEDMNKVKNVWIEQILNDEEIKEIIKNNKKKNFLAIKGIHARTKFPVSSLCSHFEVTRQGYYAWIKNGSKVDPWYDQALLEIVQKIYLENRKNYGYRRINALLKRNYNIYKSDRTILRYMQHLGIKSEIRVKKYNKEIKNTKFKIKNIIDRDFKSEKPDQKWFIDESYVKSKNKHYYLCAIIDSHDKSIVAFKLSTTRDLSLAIDVLKEAIISRKPKNVIIHSDHGAIYCSPWFGRLCEENNITQSMSKVADHLDNQPIEYFFSIYKQEYLRHIPKPERIREILEQMTREAMYHYNNVRIQGCLNWMTPLEYKKLSI